MKKILLTLILILTACLSHAQTLYGTTVWGGGGEGSICKLDLATNTLTAAFNFGFFSTGANPYGSLVQASDGKLYGMTGGGGSYPAIFSYDPVTTIYAKLLDFYFLYTYTNGFDPEGSLIQASDGKLYGMTGGGGSYGSGVIFSYDPVTATFAKLLDFDGSNGGNPYGSLVQASNGKLYGMTNRGGGSDNGVIFSYNPATATYAKLQDFDRANGGNPHGSLIQASDGKLYGMTNGGGGSDVGVIFSYDPATATYVKLLDFDRANGGNPYGSLVQASNGKLYGMTYFGGSSDNGVIFSYDPATATYVKLQDFDYTNGRNPYGSLMQASDGKLYGMTESSGPGTYGVGVSFSFDPVTGIYTKLADFTSSNGANPRSSFIELCVPTTRYRDADGDGFGDLNNPTIACLSLIPPPGYVTDSSDCDDTKLLYTDNDGDGFGTGSPLACGVANNTDCNDNDASTHPGAIEICDGKDNNCNGLIDDGCSIVAIAPQPASVNEGNKGKISMTFVVSLSAPAITSCSVKYQTVPVTATAGTDYVSVSGTLSFKKGQASKTVVVKINGDTNPEANETFNLVLSNPANLVISQSTAVGTIINDDGALLTKQTTYSSYSIPKSIDQEPACSRLIIPTLLQKNQIWNIQGLPQLNTIILFNTNGQTVFKADNYKNNNGFSNLTPGVYFYEIVLRNKEGKKELCRGKMTIVSY